MVFAAVAVALAFAPLAHDVVYTSWVFAAAVMVGAAVLTALLSLALLGARTTFLAMLGFLLLLGAVAAVVTSLARLARAIGLAPGVPRREPTPARPVLDDRDPEEPYFPIDVWGDGSPTRS